MSSGLSQLFIVFTLFFSSILLPVLSCNKMCNPANVECNVECQGSSCRGCNIYCSDDVDCTLYCYDDYDCQNAIIHCPRNAVCTIYCGYYKNNLYVCEGMSIYALNSTALIIYLRSDRAMQSGNIECPDNGMYIESALVSSYPCQILFYNGASLAICNSTITAVEGLHDINIDCGFTTHDKCLHGDEEVRCTADGSSSCILNSTTTCNAESVIGENCETYILSSPNPTKYPTNVPTVNNIFFS